MKILLGSFIFIALFLHATRERNETWHTTLSLWQDTAKKSPLKYRVHVNLGQHYMSLGQRQDAIQAFKKANSLNASLVENLENYWNLGVCLEDIGRGEEAIAYYELYCGNGRQTMRRTIACERFYVLSRGKK